jgi:GH25 family lysozyme M1 (1,4-beta-N-acetylmuramidase)
MEVFMLKFHKKILSLLLIFTTVFFVNINVTYALTSNSNSDYQGIDVSDWQGYIDYSQVRQSGIEVVYIKSSQGSNFKDPYFDVNYENAKLNGLKVGFYHFLTATNTRRSRTRSKIFCVCNSW